MAKRTHFLGFDREREEKREREESRLPSKIYGVPLVGFRQAKNESLSHQRGYMWVPEKRDFAEDPRGEISGN